MAAITSAPFVAVFACLSIFVLCEDTKNVTVKTGEDSTLYCQVPKDEAITVIQWSVPDLKSQEYVFLYHSKKIHKSYQLSSYHGRVELKDPDMKDGDASIVLKNVSISDSGRYECLVSVNSIGRTKRNEPKLTSIVNLHVTDSGHTSGHTWGGGDTDGGNKGGGDKHEHVGLKALSAFGLMTVTVVSSFGFWLHKRSMRKISKQPADDDDGEQGMLEH